MTNSLIVLERIHFPDFPPETATLLALLAQPQPLSALLDDRFREHHGKFGPALMALGHFLDWFREQYDMDLHVDTLNMLQDTMLLLRTCQSLIELAPPNPVVEEAPPAMADPLSRATADPSADPNAPCMTLLPGEY